MINILNKKISNRTLLIAISFIAVFQLSVIWLRTGYYPLPAGDDVMFADSAYNLITEGKLRKTVFGDDHIRAYKDFWPPVIMLVQALSFFMFGLSQFSMGFPVAYLLQFYSLFSFY